MSRILTDNLSAGLEEDGSTSTSEFRGRASGGPQARRRIRRIVALGSFSAVFGILWLLGLRIGTSPNPLPDRTLDQNRLAALVAEHVESDFKLESRIGLVVGAVDASEEIVLGFGVRRLGRRSRVDANTLFEIGSITKAFTGILLADQIERGELALDTRVSELLPNGWSLSETAREITLGHLTTHTSGFPRAAPGQLRVPVLVNMILFGTDPYRGYSEAMFREDVSRLQLSFRPGTERQYSNFAVQLLGHILATRSGAEYGALVGRRIFQPLGMTRTVTSYDSADRSRVAEKYRSSRRLGPIMLGREGSETLKPMHLLGSGGILSTGGDMLKFLKANMGRVKTSIQPAIERSHQIVFRETDRRAMGMNWIRSSYNYLSQPVIWHNGGSRGHSSYLGFTEDGRSGVVVLSNTGRGVGRLARTILRSLETEARAG